MTRQTAEQPETVQIDLGSQEDCERLRAILAGVAPAASVTMTLATRRDIADVHKPHAYAASYADAMRQVEASYYDAC